MTRRSRRLTVLATVLAALLGAGLTGALAVRPSGPAADDAQGASGPSHARTALPALTPAAGEPTLPGLQTSHPRPGTIARMAGPFDERYELSGLHYEEGRLHGVLTITSDVSDVLELQVLAGFYDAEGHLLATGRFVRHGEIHNEAVGHTPDETLHFGITVPRGARSGAVSAAVGVPVLVNE
jgi:hypothetical protein